MAAFRKFQNIVDWQVGREEDPHKNAVKQKFGGFTLESHGGRQTSSMAAKDTFVPCLDVGHVDLIIFCGVSWAWMGPEDRN